MKKRLLAVNISEAADLSSTGSFYADVTWVSLPDLHQGLQYYDLYYGEAAEISPFFGTSYLMNTQKTVQIPAVSWYFLLFHPFFIFLFWSETNHAKFAKQRLDHIFKMLVGRTHRKLMIMLLCKAIFSFSFLFLWFHWFYYQSCVLFCFFLGGGGWSSTSFLKYSNPMTQNCGMMLLQHLKSCYQNITIKMLRISGK